MPPIVTDSETFPLLHCAEALPLYAAINGPPAPGHWRTCTSFGEGPELVSWVYDWRMAYVYRMVSNFEFKTPPTNSAVFTSDWEWIGEGAPPSDAYESVEAKYDNFFTAITTVLSNDVKMVGYRWSEWKEDFEKTEPSFRYATRNISFTAAGDELPPQVAMAITEETSIRRRWGRFYLPFLTINSINTGRFTSAVCNTVGAATATLLSTIEDEWRHVTVSKLTPHLLPTEYVRVDDVPDTIRRRRWRSSTFRYRGSVT